MRLMKPLVFMAFAPINLTNQPHMSMAMRLMKWMCSYAG